MHDVHARPGCPAASTTYLCPDYDDTLFCLVPKCMGAVDPCWPVDTDNTSFTAPNLHPFPKEGLTPVSAGTFHASLTYAYIDFVMRFTRFSLIFRLHSLRDGSRKVHYRSIRQNISASDAFQKIPGSSTCLLLPAC